MSLKSFEQFLTTPLGQWVVAAIAALVGGLLHRYFPAAWTWIQAHPLPAMKRGLKRMLAITSPQPQALIVSGLGETPGDSSPIWQLVAKLQAAGYSVTCRAWDSVAIGDYAGKSVVIVYSWGTAATWHLNNGSPACDKLVIMAGVPNPFFGQFGSGIWSVGANVGQARAFTLEWEDDYFLADPGISNATVNFDVGDTADLHLENTSPAARLVNVACDSTGANHRTLPGVAAVQAAIMDFLDVPPTATAAASCPSCKPRKRLAMICGVDCHPGDAICNNYCNEAPQKGPMACCPPPGPDWISAVPPTASGK